MAEDFQWITAVPDQYTFLQMKILKIIILHIMREDGSKQWLPGLCNKSSTMDSQNENQVFDFTAEFVHLGCI